MQAKKSQEEIHYQALLGFISDFNNQGEEKLLIEGVDNFLQNGLGAGPLIVYSFAKNKQVHKGHTLIETCRCMWNKKVAFKAYDKELVESTLQEILKSELGNKRCHQLKEGGGELYSLYCGESEDQYYMGFFRSTSKFEEDLMKYLIKFIISSSNYINRLKEMTKFKSLIYIDDVTGLFNQRKLHLDLESAIKRYREIKEHFTVLFIDIDHFKNVNDGHGHLVGTQLLSEMAKLLKEILRDTDLCYRYGGDEFVIIIPDATAENGKFIGKRILKVLAGKEFAIKSRPETEDISRFRLSLSIGVAGFPDDAKSKEEVLAIADKMMYQAKKSGRGQVCHAGELFSEGD